MGEDTKRTSISLPAALLEKGQRIAKLRRRNFSNYLADLISSDQEAELAERGASSPKEEK